MILTRCAASLSNIWHPILPLHDCTQRGEPGVTNMSLFPEADEVKVVPRGSLVPVYAVAEILRTNKQEHHRVGDRTCPRGNEEPERNLQRFTDRQKAQRFRCEEWSCNSDMVPVPARLTKRVQGGNYDKKDCYIRRTIGR